MDYRLQAAYGRKKPNTRAQSVRFPLGLYIRYLNDVWLWMAVDSFLSTEECFEEVRKLSINEPDWFRETTQMLNQVEKQYDEWLAQIVTTAKGATLLNKDYRKEIEQELLELSSIMISEESLGNHPANNLIIEIKDAVQKGNRTNFKLIQELQQKLEELAEGSIGSQQENFHVVSKAAELHTKDLIKLLLETFDLLDLVRTSALVKEDEQWNRELNLVVQKALDQLRQYGLEEIDVQSQLFDGEIMEGISRILMDELPSGYQRYQVYAVTQRGFINSHTKELVRKAKVTTVY